MLHILIQVGLRSMMIHSQFKLVPGGSLELIRRCLAVSCKGHCVCAAQGKRCSLKGIKCQDISKGLIDNCWLELYKENYLSKTIAGIVRKIYFLLVLRAWAVKHTETYLEQLH